MLQKKKKVTKKFQNNIRKFELVSTHKLRPHIEAFVIIVLHTPLDQQPLGSFDEAAQTANLHASQFIQILHVVGSSAASCFSYQEAGMSTVGEWQSHLHSFWKNHLQSVHDQYA